MAKVFQEEIEPPLWIRLRQAQLVVDARIAEFLGQLDLDTEVMMVVYAIDRCDGGTIQDVAKLVALDEAALERSVRALQLRGLVTRAKPKEAAAAVELRFTTEGRKRVMRAHNALTKFDERMGRWLGSHRERLGEALDRLDALPDQSG